ncbi:hypothetical protein [Butyrivibrio sp. WCD2001]|uniref:hypothetical protein n=1 Tax=Butyrivibrio sp. WCD2001 TaxID=1280681 RepID=UPI0003F506E0|nr:hypothetical protein [Butyrivibrio sp. WCD2001]
MRKTKTHVILTALIFSMSMLLSACNNSGEVTSDEDGDLKPVMYFYPTEDNSAISASIDYDGVFSTVYPDFSSDNTWNFIADKDGTISISDKEYGYLFWEGTHNGNYTITSGDCVAKEDLVPFLEDKLTALGLTDKEKDDFITFWLPRLSQNSYNLISFDNSQYLEKAKLLINPSPDTLIRVYMTYTGCDNPVEIAQPEEIITPSRNGFTVVEWGGSEVKEYNKGGLRL